MNVKKHVFEHCSQHDSNNPLIVLSNRTDAKHDIVYSCSLSHRQNTMDNHVAQKIDRWNYGCNVPPEQGSVFYSFILLRDSHSNAAVLEQHL